MNPSSFIENGCKTRFASELEDLVFLLTHLCEIEPVSSRIFLEELEKARWFSFREKGDKKASPVYTFGLVVAQTIKQLLKTKRNQKPRMACTSASAGIDQPNGDFSVLRDILATCYISFLPHPG